MAQGSQHGFDLIFQAAAKIKGKFFKALLATFIQFSKQKIDLKLNLSLLTFRFFTIV